MTYFPPSAKNAEGVLLFPTGGPETTGDPGQKVDISKWLCHKVACSIETSKSAGRVVRWPTSVPETQGMIRGQPIASRLFGFPC